MIYEYPDYYEKFECIGGKCTDTCCGGWEVDLDEYTYDYYRSIEGPFGDKLRRHFREYEEGMYIPLAENGKCPFLDCDGLCEIYKNLGKEALSTVCTEYPRYFIEIGSYEQIDLSLSCIELARIFFEAKEINYVSRENPYEDNEPLPYKLMDILYLRDMAIDYIKHGEAELSVKIAAIIDYIEEKNTKVLEEDSIYEKYEKPQYSYENIKSFLSSLIKELSGFETIDVRWKKYYKDMDNAIKKLNNPIILSFNKYLRKEYSGLFAKLSIYFIFRYFIDAYNDTDMKKETKLLKKSLGSIYLMLFSVYEKDGKLSDERVIDIIHFYSKEAEHSSENIEILKL